MTKIPTAEEFFDSYFKSKTMTGAQLGSVKSAMIEFTKIHVEQALKDASENIKNDSYYDSDSKDHYDSVLKPKILNSYPLDKIK